MSPHKRAYRHQLSESSAIATLGAEFPAEGSYGLVPKAYVLPNGPTTMVSTPHSSRTVWDGARYIWHDYWKAPGLKLR